ncbi:hypothetical protein VU04_02265 [Desulfobulbus sp. TB]|nr:hypothetical protein [Desulfobulbus sp. TB]
MANRYISTLSAVRKDDIDTVGGKGANLGELAGKGFPVPAGFVVSAEAYSLFFSSLRLQKNLLSLKDEKKENLVRSCGVIRNTITNAIFPGELAESILAAHQQLIGDRSGETLCAVRSSATTDDLSEASFAGQHATYYYVERANLLRMIQYCWASLWSKEAVSYRNRYGLEHSVAMAVVIQEMVCSEISGITFTADPITGADKIVIEASWGMGAAIVDGRVTPDRYTLDCKSLQVIKQRIAEKSVMVPSKLQSATSSRLTEVPPGLQQQQTLSPKLLKTVAGWALKAEKYFGFPVSIEWAFVDNNFYILQSRPIASGGRRGKSPAPLVGQYVLFKAVNNRSAEPFTPLTAHLISLAASPVLRSIDGHCYLDLKYIRPLIPFHLSDSALVDLFSASSVNDSVSHGKFSFPKLALAALLWLGGYLLFGVFWARSRNLPKDFSERDILLCKENKETPGKKCDPLPSLLRLSLLPKIFDPIGTFPLWMNMSSVRHVISSFSLRMLIQRWLPERRTKAFALFHIDQDSFSSNGVHATLERLVYKAGQFPSIRDQILHFPSDQVVDILKKNPNARPFLQLFKKFIEQYGYRAAKELELQSARWKDHPNHVIRLIRERLVKATNQFQRFKGKDGSGDKKFSTGESAGERTHLMQSIKRELETTFFWERYVHLRWYLLLFFAEVTKRFRDLGENSRSYHLLTMSAIRKKLLCLEKEFMHQGVLKCKGDIFFLRLQEIAYIQQGLLSWPDIEERIHQRRHDLIRAARRTPARAIGVDLPDNRSSQPTFSKRSCATLPGQIASPGSYTGRARVIMRLSEASTLNSGEILVAPYTDSNWTPFFPTAGGAVVEVGSYLSHAGIAAREYILPCIVDVAGCTQCIQTGDLLWINGIKGEVQILESCKKLEKKKSVQGDE